VRSVRIKNVASYLAAEDVAIDVYGPRPLAVDVIDWPQAITNSFDTLGIGSLAPSASPRCETL
jgi:hypothetical protein